MPSSAVSIAVGGTAVVACVHNREKRKVTELAFNPVETSLHLCSCCENLFTEASDEPMFCPVCEGGMVYQLQAPLPSPHGRI